MDILKQHAIRTKRPVADVVGRLAAEAELPERASTTPGRAKRFARLFIDDTDWFVLRSHAEAIGIPVGILLGTIVEAEARRLGWLPKEER